jgi:hypothetical protein
MAPSRYARRNAEGVHQLQPGLLQSQEMELFGPVTSERGGQGSRQRVRRYVPLRYVGLGLKQPQAGINDRVQPYVCPSLSFD